MTIKFAVGAILLFGVGLSNAWAGFDEEMNKMFGSMTNVTDPTGYKDQSRGVLSGGHVVMKNKIVSADLLGFDPPSIDAGCGGVDFYGGSFSFISADQFVSLLRGIGSNAVGYAFKLGLQSMCPSCAATMEDLRKTVQQMNELASNSCNIAKKGLELVGIKSPTEISSNLEKSWFAGSVIGEGGLSGAFDGFLDDFNKPKSNAMQGGSVTQQAMGNIAWRVIAQSSDNAKKMADWFEFGDDNLGQLIMSLTGTIIITKPTTKADGTGPADDKTQAKVISYPPTVSLEDIMGSADKNITEVEIYECTTDSVECLEIDWRQKDFKTMASRVREILLGSVDGATPGVVVKFVSNSGALTNEEKAFLEIVPLHGKRLRDLAIYSPTGAQIYANKAADKIALELTSQMVFEVINAIKLAAAMNSHEAIPAFMAELAAVERSLVAEDQRISQAFATDGSLDALFDSLQSSGTRINWATMQDMLKKRAAGGGNQGI